MEEEAVAAEKKLPGTAVEGGVGDREAEPVGGGGHLPVSELVSDRAAAPSPFGDDQTFPLPVDRLSYIPSTSA